jgi:probable rRNA maturation factor
MRILNRQYRGADRTTDVLSFPQEESYKLQVTSYRSPGTPHSPLILGDIVINLHQAKRQAAEHSLIFNEELKKLLIHGLLHLTGYDHEKGGYDEKKMKRKEKELLSKIS